MSRQIKLIWDFRGPAAAKTAEHEEARESQVKHSSDAMGS